MHRDPSVASSSFLQGEDWLAFNMIQTCVDYDRIVEAVAADYARSPAKPVVMAEGGYEGLEFGRLQESLQIRQQAFRTQLAGGHHVYGHNDAWQAPREWERWLDSPGARDLKVFREIVTALPGWEDLVPDQSLLISDAGRGPGLDAAARSAEGRWAVGCLGAPGTAAPRADALGPGRGGQAVWIRPATGERLPAGEIAPGEAPSRATPAGWDDALFLLEAV